MMTPPGTERHDHLVHALEALRAAIETKDATAAAGAMERTLALFAQTPNIARDERLAPLMASCEAAARAFHAQLGEVLRASGASARAADAYAPGGARKEP